jgi:hypothetical protein
MAARMEAVIPPAMQAANDKEIPIHGKEEKTSHHPKEKP